MDWGIATISVLNDTQWTTSITWNRVSIITETINNPTIPTLIHTNVISIKRISCLTLTHIIDWIQNKFEIRITKNTNRRPTDDITKSAACYKIIAKIANNSFRGIANAISWVKTKTWSTYGTLLNGKIVTYFAVGIDKAWVQNGVKHITIIFELSHAVPNVNFYQLIDWSRLWKFELWIFTWNTPNSDEKVLIDYFDRKCVLVVIVRLDTRMRYWFFWNQSSSIHSCIEKIIMKVDEIYGKFIHVKINYR